MKPLQGIAALKIVVYTAHVAGRLLSRYKFKKKNHHATSRSSVSAAFIFNFEGYEMGKTCFIIFTNFVMDIFDHHIILVQK